MGPSGNQRIKFRVKLEVDDPNVSLSESKKENIFCEWPGFSSAMEIPILHVTEFDKANKNRKEKKLQF